MAACTTGTSHTCDSRQLEWVSGDRCKSGDPAGGRCVMAAETDESL